MHLTLACREQASNWPENPLHKIINWIKVRHPSAIIADMGCGDAELAASLKNKVHSFDMVAVNDRVVACDMANVPLKDKSVDIVVFCLSLMGINIGKEKLISFECFPFPYHRIKGDFIKEAHRILKEKGILKVVEVRSRFDQESGSGIKKFCRFLKRAGFDPLSTADCDSNNSSAPEIKPANLKSSSCKSKDSNKIVKEPTTQSNKMFFEIECRKSERQCFIDEEFAVKACVYKKR